AFAIAIGGTSGNENLEATPLVEDGFMYMTDAWGVVYKIDVRSGKSGRVIWKMDPGQERIDRNRGVALWGNLVISVVGGDARVVATDKETGKVVWDKKLDDQRDLTLNAAPLALKDEIVVGASGGDQGVRDWLAALDPQTGALKWRTYPVPAPGEPGSQTWKDNHSAWQTGGGAFYVTGTYDPDSNLTYWGSGNPSPKYDSSYRPGDNLYTDSALAIDAATGKIVWYHQYTPNDTMDYDETGTHIVIDSAVNGTPRKLLTHAGRNGFYYTFDRVTGQFLKATQYVPKVTWTKGIDPETGKPEDYDPAKDLQTYAQPIAKILAGDKSSGVCPAVPGGSNFWPAAYSERTRLLYIPEIEGCSWIDRDQTRHVPGKFEGGNFGYDSRLSSGLVVVDPSTGAVKQRKELPYADTSGALATAGGIVVTATIDGTVMVLDDQTLDELWSINVGTGINAPPMTYAINGKQYIAIATGLTANQKGRVATTPELKGLGTAATMIFVFAL
ncbi:MAG TPA: PQQ-binding-like beta-propeller repeat protein, partial [Stellaceae bacterium]|nr:PQQ-binding-like beta-propeller repeat protein [Stellaceae bacterium]